MFLNVLYWMNELLWTYFASLTYKHTIDDFTLKSMTNGTISTSLLSITHFSAVTYPGRSYGVYIYHTGIKEIIITAITTFPLCRRQI